MTSTTCIFTHLEPGKGGGEGKEPALEGSTGIYPPQDNPSQVIFLKLRRPTISSPFPTQETLFLF